jgi:hypothetical protein
VGGLLEHLPSLSQMKVGMSETHEQGNGIGSLGITGEVKGTPDSNRDTERVRPGGRIGFGPSRIGQDQLAAGGASTSETVNQGRES